MAAVNRRQHPRNRAVLRRALIALSLFSLPLLPVAPAAAQVGISVSTPGISIGIHQPFYPELVPVPGTPVYYAPQAQTNYFFYDGLFWVYQDDRWYSSVWFDGPWDLVDPYDVPLFVLRVPVRYYVRPPVYFYGWVVTAPPRWDIHWGPRWVQHRHGWNHWNHHSVPRPAPPPVYQRHYSGERYPRPEAQHDLHNRYYRYQPHDANARRHAQERPVAQVPPPVQIMPPGPADAPRAQYPQHNRDDTHRPPAQAMPQREPVMQAPPTRQSAPQRQEAQTPQWHRQEPMRPAQPAPAAAPVFVQPQAAPVQSAPMMAPPPGRDHPAQTQRPAMRQDAPQPMRLHDGSVRNEARNQGKADRGRGPERMR